MGEAQREFTQHYPRPGWVEHDANEIWDVTLGVMREALDDAEVSAGDIAAIGITNQRETVVMWDRETGEPVHNAIVWQDRREAQFCTQLSEEGYDDMVANKTGLVIDAVFLGFQGQVAPGERGGPQGAGRRTARSPSAPWTPG